ncbi:MAG: hypothetical protein ACEQR8_07155 [Cypionkella sp.]
MRGTMFRNRWFALLFVALVLSGVARIVGTGNGDSAIDLAKRQIAEQRRQASAESLSSSETPAGRSTLMAFTPDEELIDPAMGFDPSPAAEGAPASEDEEPPHDTLVVIRHGGPGTAPDAPDQ